MKEEYRYSKFIQQGGIDLNNIDHLEPKRVFYYFDQMTRIPRCSHKEEQIADYLENFAKEHKLDYTRDHVNNIILRKPASPGYENAKPVILQGHMDMVCEKELSCEHHFETDPIQYELEGDFIIAKNTTLGADNGIALAMALAILESEEYAHPPLEVLLTVNEEDGMTGAKELDGTSLEGKRLINLDSETEGVACISCAGGERDLLIFPREVDDIRKERQFYQLIISGLKGGHSGSDISIGLGNANKLLARALYRIMSEFDIRLIDIEGGAKPNAIPRYAMANIAILPEDKKQIQNLIVGLNREFVGELGKVDPDIRLNFEKNEKNYNQALTQELTRKIIFALNLLPNGVQTMSHDIEGLVESSVNVGVVKTSESEITLLTNSRSSSASLKNEISCRNKMVADLTGAKFEVQSAYPAWEYKEHSELREVASEVYENLTGKELKLEAIHAGLECGLFVETIGDIDMLSIGPNIYGAHAPGERMEISSTQRVFHFVIEILKHLK